MKGERQLLRLGEYLVARACRRLPREVRTERYREWAAELPAILQDPEIRAAPWRAARMLGYAADTLRGAVLTPGRARGHSPRLTAVLSLFLLAQLGLVAWDTWSTVLAPGNGLNYLQLAWALLVAACLVSVLARSTARMTTLIVISGNLVGAAVSLWQAPRDWWSYFVAALLLLVTVWLVSRWAVGFTHGLLAGMAKARRIILRASDLRYLGSGGGI